MKPPRKLSKRKLSPVTTAIVLIAVLGAVLYVYTKGLLGEKKAGGAPMGGGAGPQGQPIPPRGLPDALASTVAGYREPGLVDGKGWEARFNGPAGIAAGPDGSLFVADGRNHRLRRVAPDTTVTTIAGSGPADSLPGGFADGPADRARLFNPSGVAVGPDGSIYFADSGNHRVRCLKDLMVTTVAGSATEKDESGCEQGGYRDGPAATAQFRFPTGVALAPDGSIWVADAGNRKIRRIAGDAVSTVAAPGLKQPVGLALGPGGALAIADPGAGVVWMLAPGGKPTPAARGGLPPKTPLGLCALAADPNTLAVVDGEWSVVHLVGRSTSVLLAGELPAAPMLNFRDGGGHEAWFAWPCGVASVDDRLYVADYENNCIRAITVPPNWAAPPPPPEAGPPRRGWRTRGEENRSED
jgi:sugar lactone lactonase YvrE